MTSHKNRRFTSLHNAKQTGGHLLPQPVSKKGRTPILDQLERNALAVDVPTQSRALYWKTFAKLQLELLAAGELVEPNAMSLTLTFDDADGRPLRIVTYRRVDAAEFGRLSSKTPRTVENIARPDAANDDGPGIRALNGRDHG